MRQLRRGTVVGHGSSRRPPVQQEREHEQLGPGDHRGEAGHRQVVLERVRALSARSFERYETTSGIASAMPATRAQTRSDAYACRERPGATRSMPPGVVEQHLGDAAEKNAWQPDGEHRDAEELPVEGERDGTEVEVAEAQWQRQEQPEDDQSTIPGLKTKKSEP